MIKNIFQVIFLSPNSKGWKNALKISSKLTPFRVGEINFDEI